MRGCTTTWIAFSSPEKRSVPNVLNSIVVGMIAIRWFEMVRIKLRNDVFTAVARMYPIYSINRPGRLLNFWTLRVGAYSRLGAY